MTDPDPEIKFIEYPGVSENQGANSWDELEHSQVRKAPGLPIEPCGGCGCPRRWHVRGEGVCQNCTRCQAYQVEKLAKKISKRINKDIEQIATLGLTPFKIPSTGKPIPDDKKENKPPIHPHQAERKSNLKRVELEVEPKGMPDIKKVDSMGKYDERVKQLHAEGKLSKDIADEVGTDSGTISRILKKFGLKANGSPGKQPKPKSPQPARPAAPGPKAQEGRTVTLSLPEDERVADILARLKAVEDWITSFKKGDND